MVERIPLFVDRKGLRVGLQKYLEWDFRRCPHLLVVGATGTGKTYAVKLLLGRVSKYLPSAGVTICDYKRDDFAFLDGCPRYFGFGQCKTGLESFYDLLRARQTGVDGSRDFRLLVFDEWASYCSMLDKKQVEYEKQKLATLLMLGRSFNVHVLVSQQRADAQYFSTARDNFQIITILGNISKEAAMMFGIDRDELPPTYGVGSGFMLTNGIDLQEIQVPTIRDIAKLDAAIQRLVE